MWKVKWQTPILGGINPEHLLVSKDRIVIQGSEVWQMFDLNGKAITSNSFANGNVVLDTSNNLIYAVDNNSMIEAYDIGDGTLKFIVDGFYGTKYHRTFLTRTGNALICLSNEQIMDAHSSEKPETAYLEKQNIGGNIQTDDLSIVTTAVREKLEKRNSGLTYAATNGGSFFIAYKDKIEILNEDFSTTNALEDNFTPLALSVDDNSNIYVIVLTEEDKYALWILDSSCKKVSEFPVQAEENYFPPHIGFDGSVYLFNTRMITAVNKDKVKLWEQNTGFTHGAVCLEDNLLLVSEDKYIFAFDSTGERKFVYQFENEIASTPPIINEKGEIFVSTNKFLYCLVSEELK